jgi:hypothetical protein
MQDLQIPTTGVRSGGWGGAEGTSNEQLLQMEQDGGGRGEGGNTGWRSVTRGEGGEQEERECERLRADVRGTNSQKYSL